MPTYLLDILVEEAQLFACCRNISTPVWIRLRADGLCQSFDTPAVAACPRPSWRTAVRLVLDLPSLEHGHVKATLRTSGCLGEVLPVACAQVRLTALPKGRPARFSFPLQSALDFAVQAAVLSVTASISELALRPPRAASQPTQDLRGMEQYTRAPWGWNTQPAQAPPPPQPGPQGRQMSTR
jgi:hypothetical protein